MDKKTFLEELRKSLRVLKEEELQDIIGEYEQHIDLKVKNGLTEEQAIADFGNIKELAAEILEAYHVRAEFSFSEETDHVSKSENESAEPVFDAKVQEKEHTNAKPEKERFGAGIIDFLKKGFKQLCFECQKLVSWFRLLLHMVWSAIGWCGTQLLYPVRWVRERRNVSIYEKNEQKESSEYPDVQTNVNDGAEPTCNTVHTESTVQVYSSNTEKSKNTAVHKRGWMQRTMRGVANMLHGIWNWMVDVLIFGVRICWNCCAVGTALLIGGFGLICLYIAGVLAVLLLQGYPLTGITIGCIGVVLCLFAGAALAWTMIWHKTKIKVPEAEAADSQPVNAGEMEVKQNA